MPEASLLLAVLVGAIFYMFSTGGTTALILGVVGLPACGGTYPLMKRFMYWPSLYFGPAASWAVDWGLPAPSSTLSNIAPYLLQDIKTSYSL